MIIQLDGGYTTTEGWTGISGRTYAPIHSPSVYDNKTQAFMQQSTIPGNLWVFHQWEIHFYGKAAYRKFFDGNGQATDVTNESVAQL